MLRYAVLWNNLFCLNLKALKKEGVKMIEHKHPTPNTQKNVLAASGNQCAFPGCARLIFDIDHETLIGTIAHIHARCENGPRFDPQQREDENRSFSNLIALCAEHSKIIDGPKWKDFSVDRLLAWKAEHEERISQISDCSWIRPANSITKMTQHGEQLHFSYWVDRTGRPRLFSPQQLSILNTLMSINLLLLKLCNLPENLANAANSDVATVLQQDWAKFKTEKSVVADFCTLLAMAANVTFAEFLNFVVERNDATPLIQEAARRIDSMANGDKDQIVSNWFRSDLLE